MVIEEQHVAGIEFRTPGLCVGQFARDRVEETAQWKPAPGSPAVSSRGSRSE
jgi:hypothetical protein